MRRITIAALLMVSVLTVNAQEMYDYGYISGTNPWLTSRNASGLVSFEGKRIAVAEAGAEKSNGQFIGIEESDNSIKGALGTASYATISDRLKAYGSLSYSYFYGKNMGGPILMDPSYNPISLIEFDPATTGSKSRESYSLEGALSYKLSDSWAIGARVNYEDALCAKRKDPRFRNVWMDLDASVGTRWALNKDFAIGLALLYRRALEKLDGNIYGETSIDYFNIIDFGGFFGKKELFSGDYGYVPQSSTARNMLNNYYGAALQIQLGITFHELSWKMRSGYYGNKGSSNIVYNEHGGNELEYNGLVLLKKDSHSTKIGLDLAYSQLNNSENIFRITTVPGKSTVVEMLGNKEVLERSDIYGRLYCQGWAGLDGRRADWEYFASIGGKFRSQTATIYPYYRSSEIFTVEALARLKRNFKFNKNIFSADLGASFSMGGGNPKTDGILASSSSGAPFSADNYLNRDFEYKSIAAAGLSIGLGYTREIKDKLDVYFRLADQYKRPLKEPQFLGGKFRNIISLTIGCTF